MRGETKRIHDRLALLGERLGFAVGREVSDSLLRLRLEAGYRPVVDLMWSLPLNQKQAEAIAWAVGDESDHVSHLPVVGMEIEGTTPTTKTMGADVANLAALGAPLGLLVVSEAGEKNIYRRAARAIRSLRRSFGDLQMRPMEASWLDDLDGRDWSTVPAKIPPSIGKAPAGGETLDWSNQTRATIRRVGEEAGFVVVEPYTPPVLEATYRWLSRNDTLNETTDPRARLRRPMQKAADCFTRCEIDIAWLLPLPESIGQLLLALDDLDPSVPEHGVSFSELWTHCAVAAFELESGGGKHAGGGLLNLAAYSVIGVLATHTDAICDQLARTLKTYQPTLGLRNVFVRALP